MNSSRRPWLLTLLGLLVAVNVLYYIISNWGLITVHVNDVPLKEVIRSVERQGHVTLITNVDPETKVTMYVTKVPLTEALDTLSAVTESRWSLLYVMAPNADKLKEGVTQAQTSTSEDWKRVSMPMMGFYTVQSDTAVAPLDPRGMHWRVETPATPNLQDYLLQGSKSADVTFLVPAAWNPSIPQPPPSGTIQSVAKNLASSSNARIKEFFTLQSMRGGFRPQAGQGRPMLQDPDLLARMDERVQQQIAMLPVDEQAAAKAKYDSDKAFFQSLASLTPDERRAKMQEFFQNSDNQDRFENRDSKRTPQQRASRMSRYAANRAAARGR